jgi:hypothetical protein
LKSYFYPEFEEYYHKLLSYVQKQVGRAFADFSYDTRDSSLEFKCVNQQLSTYSIRINKKGYRALGGVSDGTVEWYWIGPHDEYMRRIRQ